MYWRTGTILAFVVALALVAAGCGSGGETATTDPSGGSPKPVSATKHGAEPALPHSNEKVPEWGEEGSEAERMAANAVVVKNLRAREDADFAAQCATLNAETIHVLPALKETNSCAAALRSFAEPLSKTKGARKDTLSGSIDSLRVGGKMGYAIWRGDDGKTYSVLMEKERGHWKVASFFTFEIAHAS
jgi:hypothetical protein